MPPFSFFGSRRRSNQDDMDFGGPRGSSGSDHYHSDHGDSHHRGSSGSDHYHSDHGDSHRHRGHRHSTSFNYGVRQNDGYRREPYPWTGGMHREYHSYKDAGHRSNQAHQNYDNSLSEVRARNRGAQIGPNQGYLRYYHSDHEDLAPRARVWSDAADAHYHGRNNFHNDHPRAYESTVSYRGHAAQIAAANRHRVTAHEASDLHFTHGSQNLYTDPYDTFDVRTGGASRGDGHRRGWNYDR